MSWKCVLVGLALILPGTLLGVEGRYSARQKESSEDSFGKSLIDFFKQERALSRQTYSDNERTKKEDSTNQEVKAQEGLQQAADAAGSSVGGDGEEEKADKASPTQQDNLNLAAQKHPQAAPLQASHSDHGGKAGSAITAGSSAMFIMIVSGCSVLGAVGIIMAGVCWYKYHKGAKAASQVEYPAYGVTGPTKDRLPSPGDRKLAQSAQMYHYQHQKQQMIAMEKANGDMKHDASDESEEEDNVEGDYTVYECPGLAPTGEMEVKNPLFRGDETPGTPANDDSRPAGTN